VYTGLEVDADCQHLSHKHFAYGVCSPRLTVPDDLLHVCAVLAAEHDHLTIVVVAVVHGDAVPDFLVRFVSVHELQDGRASEEAVGCLGELDGGA